MTRQNFMSGFWMTSYKNNDSLNDEQNACTVYGVTNPVDSDWPDVQDIFKTKELHLVLQECELFASKEEVEHRVEVVDKLQELTTLWIKEEVIKKRKLPATVAENALFKIYTSGFYRLDAYMKDAVVETLCLASHHVERKEFFTSFVAFLRKQSGITDVLVAEQAYVPFIQITFERIKLKMVFARTALSNIPANLCLRDKRLLKDMGLNCIRSLNSCSVIDEILHLVPNQDTFRCALHAIILWAKKEGVYCNLPGYLGGISLAILVARTCQFYPNAAASTIVHRFFLVYSHWQWPVPIILKEYERNMLHLHVWDPHVHVGDCFHPMPIITPSYPYQNAGFNISFPDKDRLLKCFQKGLSTMDDILQEKDSWIKLFESASFFLKYKNFLLVTASSVSKNEHFERCQLVEPKIQFLAQQIERHRFVKEVQPNLEVFTPLEVKPGMYQSMWFVGLQFKETENPDLTSDIQSFHNSLARQAWTADALQSCKNIDVQHVERKELYKYLPTSVIDEMRKKETASNSSLEDKENPSPEPTDSKEIAVLSDSDQSESSLGDKENSSPEPTDSKEIAELSDSDKENTILIGNDKNAARKRRLNAEEKEVPCSKRVLREYNMVQN